MESFTWFDELMAFIHGWIERKGWSLMHVNGDATDPPWTYTIGLVERFAHPELIVVGLECSSAGELLNALADDVASGCRFEAGEWIVGESLTLGLGPVHEDHWVLGRFAKWLHYYDCVGHPEDAPAALQVIWPDESGHFPGDPGFPAKLARIQPLLEFV